MSSYTIYIRHVDPKSCVQEIFERAVQIGVELNPLAQERPGDKFSRLLLGTHNFVRTSGRGAEDRRQKVLDHITRTTVIVGVPSADAVTISAVVANLDAVVFDGQTVRASSGEDLLV